MRITTMMLLALMATPATAQTLPAAPSAAALQADMDAQIARRSAANAAAKADSARMDDAAVRARNIHSPRGPARKDVQ